MAEVTFTGSNSAGPFSFSFASYQVSDVRVSVDGTDKTVNTHYTISNYTTTGGGQVTFTTGNVPTSTQQIRIYRSTDISSIKASFAAGSSIRSEDLNNNFNQLLLSASEPLFNVGEDISPELGGDLDLNDRFLNGNLNVKKSSNNQPELRLYCKHDNGETHYASIKAPNANDFQGSNNLTFRIPSSYPTQNGQVLSSITNGTTSWVTRLESVVEDTTPHLIVTGKSKS